MGWIVGVLPFLVISAGFAQVVTAVEVRGAAPAVNLATQVGRPVDAGALQRDVQALWGLGRFDDVWAEQVRQGAGVAIVFRVTPRPNLRLREIRVEPNSFGLHPAVMVDSPIDRLRAHQIAMEAERELNAHGYANARVREELQAVGRGRADLRLSVEAGEAMRVKAVRIEGAGREIDGGGALRALRIRRILPGWRLLPAFTPEAVEADAARLRSRYMMRGYFDADVQGAVEMRGRDASVKMRVRPGARRAVSKDLCGELLAKRREAQRRGVLNYSVKLDAGGVIGITAGPAYRVGRIDFIGNHHYSDAAIRRNFVLIEGQAFDEQRLRESIARLNRTGWFAEIESRDVAVRPDAGTGLADVRIEITERQGGSWRVSGPVGPASVAGPVQAAIASRLPAWGRGFFELSTYAGSINVFAFARPLFWFGSAWPKSFMPVAAVQRAFTPGEGWRSGFTIAPQLGWRNLGAGYAVAQVQGRLVGALAGGGGSALEVTVERAAGEAVMYCETPRPRMAWMREAVGVGVRVAGF